MRRVVDCGGKSYRSPQVSPLAAPNVKVHTGIEGRRMPKPLLLISDAIDAPSGLARITRELAERIHLNLGDVIRLGTAGYGGTGGETRWKDYHLNSIENWMVPELPSIAKKFAGDQELTVCFIWDCSRLAWFADPEYCPIPGLRAWLEKAKIRKWTYSAIDAAGPQGGLSVNLKRILGGFDRVLNYSKFSSQVTGYPDHIPHGIDTSQFRYHDRNQCKDAFQRDGICRAGAVELFDRDCRDQSSAEGLGAWVSNCARVDGSREGCPPLVPCGCDSEVLGSRSAGGGLRAAREGAHHNRQPHR